MSESIGGVASADREELDRGAARRAEGRRDTEDEEQVSCRQTMRPRERREGKTPKMRSWTDDAAPRAEGRKDTEGEERDRGEEGGRAARNTSKNVRQRQAERQGGHEDLDPWAPEVDDPWACSAEK